MMKRRTRTRGFAQTDLFGNPIKIRRGRSQIALERYDANTLSERIARLDWLNKIFPHGYGTLMPTETTLIFLEAKMTFLNGEFISTLLLASAVIEHVLGAHLEHKGFTKAARSGLGAIIECASQNGLVHDYLLSKATHLQRIRNPFVHLKPFGHKHSIIHRGPLAGREFGAVLEKDAKEALSTMYAIVIGPLR